MLREIALDTETTGLDPASGHRIVEIGCVEMLDNIRTGKVYHVYLNPERDMPAEAERIHGLSAAFLKDKPLFSQARKDFIDFIQDSTLVIHNAGFDMKFINAELQRSGYPAIPMSRALDTVALAKQKFPGQAASLDALCRRFNIDLSMRNYHGALLDAELLADVYLELRGGRQKGLLLDETLHKTAKNEQENHTSEPLVQRSLRDVPVRIFSASSDEITSHHEFIKKLKKPIWENYLTKEEEAV
jgi:DNA polymerase-3 subunit epsilon